MQTRSDSGVSDGTSLVCAWMEVLPDAHLGIALARKEHLMIIHHVILKLSAASSSTFDHEAGPVIRLQPSTLSTTWSTFHLSAPYSDCRTQQQWFNPQPSASCRLPEQECSDLECRINGGTSRTASAVACHELPRRSSNDATVLTWSFLVSSTERTECHITRDSCRSTTGNEHSGRAVNPSSIAQAQKHGATTLCNQKVSRA